MKKTIITIIATSFITSVLTVGGMAIFIPKMISMPEMPDMAKMEMPDMSQFENMSKMEMPDMETIMSEQMDGVIAKMMASMPKMDANKVKDMQQAADDMDDAVEDMEHWAGKMEDSGDEMEVIRDQMAAIFNAQVMGTVMALIAYANEENPAGICGTICSSE